MGKVDGIISVKQNVGSSEFRKSYVETCKNSVDIDIVNKWRRYDL